MQITPLANESVISAWYVDCYDCHPVVYPPLPPEESVMENVALTITYRWHHPHDFSSVWWLIFRYYNWCKLNHSHLVHMYYVVSSPATRTRSAHLSGERTCWQYSAYLAVTRCWCQWELGDPVEFVGNHVKRLRSPHPRFIVFALWQSRLRCSFFFIFSHAGNNSLFQLELQDPLWDRCVWGEKD